MAETTTSIPAGATWHGADDLIDRLVELDSLTPLPGNPRQGDVGAISQSLERFGQLKPIVVDGAGVVIAGNHTYLAAQALGWTHIAASLPDHLDGEDLAAFALADNRLSDLATYDNDALLELLAKTDDLTGTGYDEDDIDALRFLLDEPLDLDALHEEVGDMTDEDYRGRLVLTVTDETLAAWKDHRTGFDSDDDALNALL